MERSGPIARLTRTGRTPTVALMNADYPASQSELPMRPAATPRSSLLACGLLLAGAAAGVFLAGGPSQGALGIFLLCAGTALTICPPQKSVGWVLWLVAAALLGCCALAFLPESWFGVPHWRQQLEAAPAIRLPRTVTLVPWTTAFWLAVLALSILSGFFLLAHPVRSPSLLAFASLATLVSGVYAALAMYAKSSGWHYPFDGGATFGFFPNRNHTATLLVTGSIVAMGVLGVALRDHRWLAGLLSAASLTTCVAALFFYSSSRGGIVFLVVGTLLWVVALGRTGRNPRLLVSVAALAAGAAVLLLASGSEVRNRLLRPAARSTPTPAPLAVASSPERTALERPPAATEVPFDFRLVIWQDTRALIRDFPLTGAGLGTFADDFAHYRRASLTESAAVHPESDWLMLAAEAGIPAVLCAGVLLTLLARRLSGLSDHPYWPLRWACVIAAGAAVLHGVVDVPLHRVALGWWLLVLAGLGLQAGSGRGGGRSRIQHALFVAGGLGALALGTQLVRAEWFGAVALPPFAAEKAPQAIIARFEKHEAYDAMNMADWATKVSPTSAPLYHLWGVLMLHFQDSEREVDEAFQAERLLSPNWPEVPLLEGDVWAVVDPKRTAALWLDAMARQRRIDQARATTMDTDQSAYYRALLDRAQRWPGVTGELAAAAARSPAFILAWMEKSDPAAIRERLGRILAEAGSADKFTVAERRRLILLWDAKGDRDALEHYLSEHPDWQETAWPLRLRRLAEAQKFEEAVTAAADHYQISLALSAPGSGTPDSEMGNAEQDAVTLFNRYWRTGNTVTARRVLAEAVAASTSQTWAPEYWRLRTALAVQDRAWPQAWQYLQGYVQATHPEDVSP